MSETKALCEFRRRPLRHYPVETRIVRAGIGWWVERALVGGTSDDWIVRWHCFTHRGATRLARRWGTA